MKKILSNKPLLGLIFGCFILVFISLLPIPNLVFQTKLALALILMTVIFWAFKVSDAGYISLLFLALAIVTNCAPPEIVFSLWTSHIMYIIIGAYLIADAVDKSGLGERIAYLYTLKFVKSFNSIIISCFVLQLILALIIPHPWPRAFLILSVMTVICQSANLSKKDTAIVGLAVFAGAMPTAMVYLTADSTINLLIVSIAGVSISWIQWFIYMGIPALAASALTCLLIVVLFKPEGKLVVNRNIIQKKLDELGKLSSIEKRTIFWVLVAVILWFTDSIHGISLGWVTILVVICMSMPKIGDLIDKDSLKTIPFSTLFTLTAAMSIGQIAMYTGLTTYISDTLLPKTLPSNIFLFAALIICISMILHMCMGSIMSVMSIAAPVFVGYVAGADISPLVPALIVYTSVAFHYILPYQHLTILIGIGEDTGKYTDSDATKLGIALTFAVIAVIFLVEIPWWKLLGLI